MKKVKVILVMIAALTISTGASAQVLNWKNLEEPGKNILTVNVGLEHGLVAGAGYAYQLKSKIPIVLNTEFSTASGDKLFDDFKAKIGGQVRLLKAGDVHFSAKVQGVFRRNENAFVRMLNFGSDMAAVIGYYRARWFAAGEAGFDKAIVTHFKHSRSYKDIYPGVEDGWFEPATGGNFYYGLQGGYSFKNSDITVRLGKLLQQDLRSVPLVPYYVSLGFNLKLKK